MQSQVELGVFVINNKRTHLEGIWNIDKASIDTEEFTTAAPKHTIDQYVRTSGWSLSFSPTALLSSIIAPMSTLPTILSVMPAVGIQSGHGSEQTEENLPMRLSANEIIIRCDDALFSGAQIKAALVNAVVQGTLTLESLTNLFDSTGKHNAVNAGLSAMFSAVTNVTIDRSVFDHTLSAVPNIRVADDSVLSEKIDTVAQLVGTERFYLKVGELLYTNRTEIGLRPGGTVIKPEDEQIIADKKQETIIHETNDEKHRVINPSFGEIFALKGQVDEYKRIRSIITQSAILENLPPEEVAKIDQEVGEFLDNLEVKQACEDITQSAKQLDHSLEQIATIIDNDPERYAPPEGKLPKPALPDYIQAQEEKEGFVRNCLQGICVLYQKCEQFTDEHPRIAAGIEAASWASCITGVGAILKVGTQKLLKFGAKKAAAYLASTYAAQQVMTAAIKHGSDALVDYAITYAETEEEAEQFAKSTAWSINTVIGGSTVVGFAGNLKNKAKLAPANGNNSASIKAKFKERVPLRHQSEQKLASIAEEKTPLKLVKKTRVINTPHHVDAYLQELSNLDKNPILRPCGKTKDGYEYFEFLQKCEYRGIKFKKGDYLSKDELHHELEWFRGEKIHKGVIDPNSGIKYKDSVEGRKLKIK